MVPGHPFNPHDHDLTRCDLRVATTGPTAVMPYQYLIFMDGTDSGVLIAGAGINHATGCPAHLSGPGDPAPSALARPESYYFFRLPVAADDRSAVSRGIALAA